MKSLQKGDSAMNTMAMNVMTNIVNKENALWNYLKKYLSDHHKVIIVGLTMMNNPYSTACRMQIN